MSVCCLGRVGRVEIIVLYMAGEGMVVGCVSVTVRVAVQSEKSGSW